MREGERRGHSPTACTGRQRKSLTNERRGFSEPNRMRIRDGWIRTQAAGRKAETKRDVEIKVMLESTKQTHRGKNMCFSVSMTLYMNYVYDLDKSFH